MSDPVRYELRDGVAVVTIDNPPVNALSPAVWERIDEAVARASADPNAEAIRARHLGLTSMEERAEAAGANLEVESTPGHGTTVVVEVGT